MPEPTLPQLRSLHVATDGQPLALRLLLPPNLAIIAPRGGRIPLKVELCAGVADAATGGANISNSGANISTGANTALPPEKLGKGPWLPDGGTFFALLLIESWCNGRVPSMLQLDAAQLCQLLQPLENNPAVFWLKAPQQPIPWQGGQLEGVHTHLRPPATGTTPSAKSGASAATGATAGTAARNPQAATTAENRRGSHSNDNTANLSAVANSRTIAADSFASDAAAAHAPLPSMEPALSPLEVDGSTNFLALRLPSRESALHAHALTLVKDNGFQLEPSNGKWWLRDRHKTLQFLADHMEDLRHAYRARFTENFTDRTQNLHFARIGVEVRSTTPRGNDAFDLELFFSAPGLDETALQQALEKGQNYIEATPRSPAGRSRDNRQAQDSRHGGGQYSAGRSCTATGDGGSGQYAATPHSTRSADSATPIILVPYGVRMHAAQAQQALGASPAQGLRSRFHSRIRKEEVATTQAVLQVLSAPANTHAAAPGQAQRSSVRNATATRNLNRTGEPTDDTLQPNAKLPAQWLALSRALNDTNALPPCPVSPALDALLRPYQRVGAAWLLHLYRNGLGGILADEMGLGKTVQCLAFLAAAARETDARQQPSLVVCPASLVENWRREAQKFVPELKVFAHHGDNRLGSPTEAAQYDLILTSYGTLVRDQALFEPVEFLIAVGDEAQHIKNAKTQNAKALRALRTRGRFLMTGTPVENDIRELQSLFTFILPGYLEPARNRGGRDSTAPAADSRAEERTRLITRAAPYILRRMKQAVATDLPEKIEQVIYCELGTEQRAFYRTTQEAARRAVQALELGGASDNRIRFAAFTELLRLRQVCIDPRLLDKNAAADSAGIEAAQTAAPSDTNAANGQPETPATGESPLADTGKTTAQQTSEPPAIPSAKREMLLELVQEAVDGGHRVLIFSQFTSALRLVAEDLNALHLPHYYLDGQTRNRTELCERFNADESVKAFLISLRAGGTGLNLTGADTVIHLDPWWNPAAQAQATDRAHRIGQQRVVTAYQLIAAGTVEEQVLRLQHEKGALLEQLLDASDAASAHIGLNDLKALLGD